MGNRVWSRLMPLQKMSAGVKEELLVCAGAAAVCTPGGAPAVVLARVAV